MGQFARCDAVTDKYEGGRVDNPKDPGGRTNRGVTQRVYNAWRRRKNMPVQDVWLISEDERHAIYMENFWTPCFGDHLPPGVDLMVYDMAVHSGVSRSIKTLQAALNARMKATGANRAPLTIDGTIADATFDALEADLDHDSLVAEFARRRQGFLQGLSTYADFGNGWSKRVAAAKRTAQAWALGEVGPVPFDVGSVGKAYELDVRQSFVSTEKLAGGVGGTTATTTVGYQVMNMFTDAKQALMDFIDLPGVKYVIIGLTVGIAVYSVVVAYKSWKAKRVLSAQATADVNDDILDGVDYAPVAR